MSNKTKKVFLLLTLLVIPFLTTACGKNNSAKDVAVEMVTKLSKDDYKNMDDIFYQGEDSYFDDEAFKAAIQDKELNISGNKTIKVEEVGDEITDQETGYLKSSVRIKIDDNKIFNVEKECPPKMYCHLQWKNISCSTAGASTTGRIYGACALWDERNTTCPKPAE